MGTPFLGEIRIISFNFAPKGWALCNGQFLPINQNQALFSILGTTYGGNGQTTFALPNLQGRTAIHAGNGFTQGQLVGQESHTLLTTEMPAHNHFVQIQPQNATTGTPNGNFLAGVPSFGYHTLSNLTSLSSATIANYGGGQPHENRMPSLAVYYIMALQGVFPSRN
jgi:microcystin-dependent protein